ncbi:SusD/RagB family nutrient-binding outer membrane lipoprotein [Halosquirtibacter xylanolyticus]|uniref:SusD/RagB family nutrient-binding outer membrane lipoprotein n=1 Tax=Halosquirtibacter xylanolyticus TaxID=3374599 RepID=UPI003748B6C4|nr:SusD/RagB family nutrient-binding outer membrane lipoprotein [Prolixibacteraceae bacterium]
MKQYIKIILSPILILVLLFANIGCKSELEEEFDNPNQYEPELNNKISGLFTSQCSEWKVFVKDYGEWYWQMSGFGVMSYIQVSGRYITPRYSFYESYEDLNSGNYLSDQGFTWFNDLYIKNRSWEKIQFFLSKASEDERANSKIYYTLSSIIKDMCTLRCVDLYNSIPYSEAFQGNKGLFFPKYDDPKEIYTTVLKDLGACYIRLEDEYKGMSAVAKQLFQKQDLIFSGDVSKWKKYTNALRLRYAIHLSGVDQEFSVNIMKDVVKDLPNEDYYWDLPHVKPADELPGGGTWHRGMYERTYVSFVPNLIANRLNFGSAKYEADIDDPRLPVLMMPTCFKDYRGVSMNADKQDQAYKDGHKYYPYGNDLASSMDDTWDEKNKRYVGNTKSMWNFSTFMHNNLPVDIFTLAEVDLLLAEAELKFQITGITVADHLKNAVIHSTDFWYAMNGYSNYPEKFDDQEVVDMMRPTKPSSGVIQQYAEMLAKAYRAKSDKADQIEMIMQQKFIHINLLRPYQLWTDLRRTCHPKLEPFTFDSKVMTPMPNRIKYPSSEFTSNTDNYMKVNKEDDFTSLIFWVSEEKKTEGYYRTEDIPFSQKPTF